MGVQLSTSNDPSAIPYFLWDEPITNSELRSRLENASKTEKTRLLAKIMRQGRDTDVWRYTTPAEVVRNWNELRPMLGRRFAFWEFLLGQWRNEGLIDRRSDESTVVDLVHEYVFQIEIEKRVINGIRIDTPDEILANKLCALLSRSEIRDLVDVHQLEIAGIDLGAALVFAAKKDSGFTPAQLAWVLSQITIGDDVALPGRTDVYELLTYLRDLIKRLSLRGFPENNEPR